MTTYDVTIQVLKVYEIEVEADSLDDASLIAEDRQSTRIEAEGKLIDVSTDYLIVNGERA